MTEAERLAPCPLCGGSKGYVPHSRHAICGACYRLPAVVPKDIEPTLDSLDAAWNAAAAHAESLRTTIRSQAAEIEALRADAERYRWLRRYGWVILEDVFNKELIAATKSVSEWATELDATIDAARQS